MATGDALSSSGAYIMLTPTSTDGGAVKPPVPSSELVARKWAAAAASQRKSRHSRELKEHVVKSARTTSPHVKEPDPEDELDPTDTDRSSELLDGDDAVSGAEHDLAADLDGLDDLEDDDAFGSFPTYVCELHDPKPILIGALSRQKLAARATYVCGLIPCRYSVFLSCLPAEHMEYNRVDIAPFDPPSSSTSDSAANKKTKKARYSDALFQYEISVGPMQEIFECTPAQVLEVYKALSKDPAIAEQLRFLETKYFRDGLLGSLKRLYVSRAKLSEEMMEVLEAISDVDAVLSHAAYLELIGAPRGSLVAREIGHLLQHHTRTPRSDPASTCMCDAYHKSVDRFGAFYKEQAASTGNPERFSTVASESLMWSRGVLSFYTDTVRCRGSGLTG